MQLAPYPSVLSPGPSVPIPNENCIDVGAQAKPRVEEEKKPCPLTMRASSFRTAAPSPYGARSHFCRTNSNRWIIIVCCVKWHVALHRSRSFVFWISHVDSIPLCHRRKPQSTISLGILLPLLPPIFSVVTIFYNVLSI